jgi:hypothetical protein
MQVDINIDCERCGKRKHSFFENSVGDLPYLCESRPWCRRIVAMVHNASGYDAQFIWQRAIILRWRPELILSGLKIICMTMEHLTFIDSISFLPMLLRKLPEAFGLSVCKSWYPHYLNTKTNLDYVGTMPDVGQYGIDEMSGPERREFME